MRSHTLRPLAGRRAARVGRMVPFAALLGAALAGPGRAAGAQGAPTAAGVAPALGAIAGTVRDSLTGELGLAGAEVYLGESVRSAVTDARGRFRIDSLPAGRYTVGFSHPTLDSLSIGVRPAAVSVEGGRTLEVLLSTPSTVTVGRALCPREASDTTGALVGSVREGSRGAPVGGAHVSVSWSDLVPGPNGILRVSRALGATTDADGLYHVCGVPRSTSVSVRASLPAAMGLTDAGSGSAVASVGSGLGIQNLVVASVATAGSGTRSGGSTLVVRLLRDNGRAPVVGGQVRVAGDSLVGVSDDAGVATITGAPLGTRTIEVRALGFAPELRRVDLRGDQRASIEVRLNTVSTLDTVRVVADRGYSRDLAGFEARRKNGFGYYLDESQIEARPAIRFTDLLHNVPGIRLQPGRYGSNQIVATRQNGYNGDCIPLVWVDGIMANGGATGTPRPEDNVDDVVMPRDVAAIEVYTTASAPLQYQVPNSCGTILVWTRVGPRPKKSRQAP